MDIRAALKGQYRGALGMLREAVERCPEEMWDAEEDKVKFWRVAYHTLFFTDLYLRESLEAFKAWKKHRAGAEKMTVAVEGGTYSKEEILEYLAVCEGMVEEAVNAMDLERKECGFHWYRMPKLDHQIVNIRHIQHHAAILAGRLRRAKGWDVKWVGKA